MAEKITEFLLDTALTLGEGIIKVAAPEIIKAIDATNDSISSQTLDLAKALDLSGAFIPGNPLAFGPALKLAKSLTSVIAGDDQKEVIDAIEWMEKQAAPFMNQADDVLQQMDVIIKTSEQLERETHDKVHEAAISAYQALDDAVAGLLAIQRGTARLQRVDPGIISKLDLAAERFGYLHKVGDTNAWKLGKDASALMSFGDSTKTFAETLQQERNKLQRQLKEHNDTRGRHKEQLNALRESEESLRVRRRKAVAELEDGWNQLAYIFDSSPKKRYERMISEADQGLEKNASSQREVNSKIQGLHLLDTLIGWAMRALDVLTASVARIAQDFQAKFRRILMAQQISDRLFAGLLGISNAIHDTNFRTSRDNSLHVVVNVLRRYHELRADHGALDIPGIAERRIQRAICVKLGEGGVRKLMEPPAPVDVNDPINDM